MTIRSDEAARMLADVESVVAKLKQSQICRNASLIFILWGGVDLVRTCSFGEARMVRIAMVSVDLAASPAR